MKKISILALHLGYGGIEKALTILANALAVTYEVEIASIYQLAEEPAFSLDKRVKVVYLNPGVKPNRDEFASAVHRKNPISILKEGMRACKVLRLRKTSMVKYIKQCDADIVIATRDILDRWLGKYGNSQMFKIGWEHNHHHGNMKYANKIVKANRKLDTLVLVSRDLTEFYKEKLSSTNCQCVYIPNIIDTIPKEVSPLTEKRFVSVGRLSPEKGYIDLLKIYERLVKHDPTWHLDIVGDGKEFSKLQEFAKLHRLQKKVTFHGFQKKEYIDDLLHRSSIYLMTSHTESFGIVLLEAMSHGLPCVAFDSAEGAREIIEDQKSGFLIKHRDFDQYERAVETLMGSIEKRRKMGKRGHQLVGQYSEDVVIEKWIDLLEGKEV